MNNKTTEKPIDRSPENIILQSPAPEDASLKIRHLERELRKAKKNKQLEILQAIIHTQEQERRRIAENLHIEIGQLLSALQIQLDHISLKEAQKMINEAIRKVRSVSFELMPSVLKDFGLESALKDMVDKKLTAAGIQCRCSIHIPDKRKNDSVNLVLFRIVQELVNNIVKHSKADQASISLYGSSRGYHLVVEDNGQGVNTANRTNGFGILNIQNRVKVAKGKFKLTSSYMNGFKVEVTLPASLADDPVYEGISY